jgi:hypothetical protein
MQTESEIKLQRYRQTEKEADVFGRIISVRRLRPSEQTKLAGMTAELTGADEVVASDGTKMLIQHRAPLMLAAAVCMIGENHITFPRNRAELDWMYDTLDVEGLAAAGKAMARLMATEVAAEPLAEAKN